MVYIYCVFSFEMKMMNIIPDFRSIIFIFYWPFHKPNKII